MKTLVLLRHGQSQWNQDNRYTGWVDVPLSELGVQEAHRAGKVLRQEKFAFDVAFTSVLKRAIKTLWISLEELDQMWIPVFRSWRLNERMYGALQGLNKAETAEQHGEQQVKLWRRSYDVPPPPLDETHEFYPGRDPRYARLDPKLVPRTECLKDTLERALPYWTSDIAPALARGDKVIIAAHGNSLRALVKHLDGMSDAEIVELNIPTGVPLLYELTDDLKPIKRGGQYLGDPEEIAKAAEAVAKQGAVRK